MRIIYINIIRLNRGDTQFHSVYSNHSSTEELEEPLVKCPRSLKSAIFFGFSSSPSYQIT